MLTATKITERLRLDTRSGIVNRALRSLGYIRQRNNKITVRGKNAGGEERQTVKNGESIPFCVWPDDIATNEGFLRAIAEQQTPTQTYSYYADSGHPVRSMGELLIANWLFYRNLTFEYNPHMPETNFYADFYLYPQDIYIEYWGRDDAAYNSRREEKQRFY